MAYTRDGSPPSEQSARVSPGGFGSLAQPLDARGRLEIVVGLAEQDTATFQVTESGIIRHQEKLTGPANWAYLVLPPPVGVGGGGP